MNFSIGRNRTYTGVPTDGLTNCITCVKYSLLTCITIFFGCYIIALISHQDEYQHCKAPMTTWLILELIIMVVFLVSQNYDFSELTQKLGISDFASLHKALPRILRTKAILPCHICVLSLVHSRIRIFGD